MNCTALVSGTLVTAIALGSTASPQERQFLGFTEPGDEPHRTLGRNQRRERVEPRREAGHQEARGVGSEHHHRHAPHPCERPPE